MNKDLIIQQLESCCRLLHKAMDFELSQAEIFDDNYEIFDDNYEITRHASAAHAYHKSEKLVSTIKDHIIKLMGDKE